MEMSKLTPFTFISSINDGRKGPHLLEGCKADQSLETANPDSPDKAYVPFMVNRGLSYFKDTVLFANEMNIHHDLPNRMQYDFYRYMVTAKRRFSKWGKKQNAHADIAIIQKEYGYSREKAEAVYPIFNKTEIQKLYKKHDKGGR
jgi:hypothetical protein